MSLFACCNEFLAFYNSSHSIFYLAASTARTSVDTGDGAGLELVLMKAYTAVQARL